MPEQMRERRTCRFCLDSEEAEQNPLIAPCACKGSSQYVHRECLKQWRTTTMIEKNKRLCQLCNEHFVPERKWPLELTRMESPILSYAYASSPLFLWLFQWGFYLYMLCIVTLLQYAIRDTAKGAPVEASTETHCCVTSLVSMTVFVLLNYLQSVLQTTNKCRYLWYMATNRTSRTYPFRTPYTVLFFAGSAWIAYQYYAPFGTWMYCVALSKLAPAHRGVLERLNEDGILALE
jgi:hypothetical protein